MVETAKIDSTLMVKTGVKFSEGSVTKIEKKIIVPVGQQNSAMQQTVDGAEVTLSNGVSVTIPLGQPKGSKISVQGSSSYFEKLSNPDIDGNSLDIDDINIIGCKHAKINVHDYNKDGGYWDTVEISDHADGTKSTNITVYRDEQDGVSVHPLERYSSGKGITYYKDGNWTTSIDGKITAKSVYVDYNSTDNTFKVLYDDGTKVFRDDNAHTEVDTDKNGKKTFFNLKSTGENTYTMMEISEEEYNAIRNPQKQVNKKEEVPNGTGEYRCAEVADPVQHKVYYDPAGKEISAFEFMMKTQGLML